MHHNINNNNNNRFTGNGLVLGTNKVDLSDPIARQGYGGYLNLETAVHGQNDEDARELSDRFIAFMKDKLHVTHLFHDKTYQLQNEISIKSTDGSLTHISDATTSTIKKKFPGTKIQMNNGIEFLIPYTILSLPDGGSDSEDMDRNKSKRIEVHDAMTTGELFMNIASIALKSYLAYVLINIVF